MSMTKITIIKNEWKAYWWYFTTLSLDQSEVSEGDRNKDKSSLDKKKLKVLKRALLEERSKKEEAEKELERAEQKIKIMETDLSENVTLI